MQKPRFSHAPAQPPPTGHRIHIFVACELRSDFRHETFLYRLRGFQLENGGRGFGIALQEAQMDTFYILVRSSLLLVKREHNDTFI